MSPVIIVLEQEGMKSQSTGGDVLINEAGVGRDMRSQAAQQETVLSVRCGGRNPAFLVASNGPSVRVCPVAVVPQ